MDLKHLKALMNAFKKGQQNAALLGLCCKKNALLYQQGTEEKAQVRKPWGSCLKDAIVQAIGEILCFVMLLGTSGCRLLWSNERGKGTVQKVSVVSHVKLGWQVAACQNECLTKNYE